MIQNEHGYRICCQPEVADDAISGDDAQTILKYAYLKLRVDSFSSFGENRKQDRSSRLRNHVNKQKMVQLSPILGSMSTNV